MKKYNGLKSLVWAAMAMIALPAVATLEGEVTITDEPFTLPDTSATVVTPPRLIFTPHAEDSLHPDDVWVPITLTGRAYGDSIVLRWAVPDFPTWSFLTRRGITVLRVSNFETSYEPDTIATNIKPLTLEQFKAKYPNQADSLAYIAMGSLYGDGDLKPEQTNYEPGTIGAFTELEQDQNMRIMSAFLVSEWRQDLADALALRFVDRNVKKGETYAYIVMPTVPDNVNKFFISPGHFTVKNEKFKPEPYNIELKDSITEHGKVLLTWNDTIHGSFEIFRRDAGKKDWLKINQAPYLPPLKFDLDVQDAIFENTVAELGTYEYAVAAHDAFGDLTQMCKPVKVKFRDTRPPRGPIITKIIIDRPVEGDPSAEIYADIYFYKDTIEDDFVRFVPLYYNERDSLKEWRLLSKKYIAPTDTMVRIDVTKVSTGMMTIAAVDTAENMGYAMPQLLRVEDLKPPKAPQNLRAMTELDGTILLSWELDDDLDVYYYDVFFANDTTHSFMRVNTDMIKSKSYMDTVSIDANQRYIYYAVRAVDYARNHSDFSDTLQVLRPNPYPPTVAHLDSAWVDDHSINIRWIAGGDEMIKNHHVYRRKQGQSTWEIIATLDGDSIAANGHKIEIHDTPEIDRYNRYEYAVETFTFWNVSSGLTPIYYARMRGQDMIDVDIKLFATYDKKSEEVRLAWEVGKVPVDAPYFFCIYRKSANDNSYTFVTDAPSHIRSFSDARTRPGETAEYYVSIRFDDGRGGSMSNVVKAVVPPKPKPEEK